MMATSNEGGEITIDKTNVSLIRRVIKKDEEKSFQDLGLGRGVDATNPTPWLNKRALQIREVSYSDIIGIDEGNLYQGFVNEVESTQQFQTNLIASVPGNQIVSLGIDSELSRNYSMSQKSVGRKITTRTISFRANFDKLCKESGVQTFEDRLKKWIKLQRKEEIAIKEVLQNQGQLVKAAAQKQEPSQKPQNSEEANQDQQGEAERRETGMVKLDDVTISQEECFKLCCMFVSTFSVTHYVHTLELGATHYRVMSLEEYSSVFNNKAKQGVGQLADIAIGNERSFNAKKYKSQTTKVGRMNMKLIADDDNSRHWGISFKKKKEAESDDNEEGEDSKKKEVEEVRRGTIDEAVVGVKLQPISSLVVGNVGLRIALQKALQHYIHDKQKVKFGPFYIACNWDQLYLTVNKNKDYQVDATYNIDKASKFYIVRCDEGDNHFYIVHESPITFRRDRDKEKFGARVGEIEHKPNIPMYLCASVNWRGRNKRNQPLRMRLDGKSTNSQMAIHSRRDRSYTPADLTEWVNEKEVFFINCQERSITTPATSYLCVYESGETGCKPTIESHDDKRKFMLFRLIKAKEKEISSPAAPVDNLIKGPFLIKHTHFNEDFYIKIGKENEIELTGPGERDDAYQFDIRCVSEYSNYFEIVSRDDQKLHIAATVDWRGYGTHPLRLRSDANGRFYMAIYDRKSIPKDSEMKPEDPSKCGKDEDEAFFISCSTKPAFSKDASYLIVNQKVKWPWGDDTDRFWIGCVPSIKHSSRNGEPMLFKFVKDEKEQEATPPRQVQDEGSSDQESDAGSVHIEVTAEMHS